MAGVTLEGVRKVYAERGRVHVAVERMDLAVADGEFLVLVGPSGCGKSTTLRMVAGLEDPSEGTVRIGDRVVNDVPARDRDIAMVFQNYALYPHMSVAENLGFALRMRGMAKGDIAARVTRAAEMLGLAAVLERRPKQLSGGQRQRVALGRAIVREPAVFLFDEPLSNLDAKLRVQMRRELAALRRRLGTTAIYVTHDQVEAMTLGDRIVVMRDGRVLQVADPVTLYRQPADTFVATFVGTPPMNLVKGRVEAREGAWFVAEEGSFRLPLGGGPGAARPAGPVTLGIRPEALQLAAADGAADAGRVVEVEPLGSETLVWVESGGVPLTARLEGTVTVRRGDAVRVSAGSEVLHWFDAERGTRLA